MESRIDVFYVRTDGTVGYKEYSCVDVRTAETGDLRYYDDLYEPLQGCYYTILYEVPKRKLRLLCEKAGVKDNGRVQWVLSSLKDVVLDEWRQEQDSNNHH